jgi:restriction system protein
MYDDLFNPLLEAMRRLGGSASGPEQEQIVAEILELSDKEVNEIHRGNRTKLSYRLAWARNYLKRVGLLVNSRRGIWALTPEGVKTKEVDKERIKKAVQVLDRKEDKEEDAGEESASWEDELLGLLKTLAPAAFERLCQRVLRESGFIHVEVLGRTGDGGIDGKGVVRIGGLLSFHVLFQAKRYKGSVSAGMVRDFRGALIGRADKGLLITTGTFTREARLEAQRDGATPIDLIDGEDLATKLKDLAIGVNTREKVVEEITVDRKFFETLRGAETGLADYLGPTN